MTCTYDLFSYDFLAKIPRAVFNGVSESAIICISLANHNTDTQMNQSELAKRLQLARVKRGKNAHEQATTVLGLTSD